MLCVKESTSITPKVQFVQFMLVARTATSIINSTKCEKVIKININKIKIYKIIAFVVYRLTRRIH